MEDFVEKVERSLDLLFKLENKSSKQNSLLNNGKTIYLQVGLFKIPFVPVSKRKFLKLKYSLYGDDPEICLFVPNRKTGVEYKKTTDELIDFCVDYYTDLLEKQKIKEIKTVMPLKQLRAEYGTYELRRKLVSQFDFFLCKNSLLFNRRFLTALGKIFRDVNKDPLGIPFPKDKEKYEPKFGEAIKRAIHTVSFFIKPFSDNYTIPVGTTTHSREQLKENIDGVLQQIFSENVVPGGFRNIRTMYLWPSQSKTIPLYLCTEIPANLPRPSVSFKKRGQKAFTGELSTLPGRVVTVLPRGEVVISRGEKDEEDNESFYSESGEENDENEGKNTNKNGSRSKKRIKKSKTEEEEEESENDEEIERKEQLLLKRKRENEEDSYSTGEKIRKIEMSDTKLRKYVKTEKKRVKKEKKDRMEKQIEKKKNNLKEIGSKKVKVRKHPKEHSNKEKITKIQKKKTEGVKELSGREKLGKKNKKKVK